MRRDLGLVIVRGMSPSELRTSLGPRPRCVVLGVQLPDVGDEAFSASLAELERLGETLGLVPIGRVTQRRTALVSASVVGAGKLAELATFTGGPGVLLPYSPKGKRGPSAHDRSEADHAQRDERDGAGEEQAADGDEQEPSRAAAPADAEAQASVVLVDHDLTPSQTRNLEKATGAQVLDRSMVILSIFQRHARTREARLQVEIARLSYEAPRLRETGGTHDRAQGGIGGKGAGESALELDRRRIRDRIAELRRELEIVEREADTRRSRRASEDAQTVALIGYTNAGKSSWMRALTGEGVYVADQLFATLDTTVRVLSPKTRPPILVSDTVGFIKKLPHDLVASFRSTLQEAREAGLLLHLLDASDPAFRDQHAVTESVLTELGAAENPRLLVLNKSDRLSEEQRAELGREFPDALLVSSRDPDDVARVHARIVAVFEARMNEAELLVPYSEQRLVAMLHERCRVLDERYEEAGTRLKVRAPQAVLGAVREQLERVSR